MSRRAALPIAGLALAALMLTPVVASDADEIIQKKIIDVAREENLVTQHLDELVNGIGPRLTASYNDVRACEWAKAKFEEWGLRNVTMEKAGEFPVAFERGPWSGRMIAPEEMALEFGTPAWSAGTRGKVSGPAKMAPATLEEAKAGDYAGAWLVSEQRSRRGNADRRRAQREITNYLRDEAGIAGFVYPTRGKYIITGGSSRVQWDKLPKVPRINLLKAHWDKVSEHLGAGKEVTLEFDIRNHFVKGPAPYYNVYADLVGSEFPDEYVVIGGHIDSWDGATGTTDDGMGVATTLEAARLLVKAGAQPRRTIRFMLWSGEEQGLLGSRAYVEANPELMKKTSGCWVYDGGPNVIAGVLATKAQKKDVDLAFAAVKNLDPKYPFEVKEVDGLPSGPGSDHLSFLGKNVPGFFWDQKGKADFRHGIHTQFDTYDLCIPEYLEHSAVVVALGALGLADLDTLLSRENLRARGGGGGGRRMGIQLEDVTITEVYDGGVAKKAGLKPGDVVLSVDGKGVTDRRSFLQAIRTGGPKKKVRVRRDGQEVDLIFEWAEEKKPEKKKVEIL